MKNIKNKIMIISLIIIFMMLSTFMTYNSFADEDDGDDTIYAKILQEYTPDYSGNVIDFSVLKGYSAVLCCGRGIHLPSGTYGGFFSATSSSAPDGYEGEGDFFSDVTDLSELSSNNATNGSVIGKNNNYFVALPDGADASTYEFENPFPANSFQSESAATYSVASSSLGTPMEIYILANLSNPAVNNGNAETSSYFSEQQRAWWMTPAGSEGSNEGTNQLYYDAVDFQEYIAKATGVTSGPEIASLENMENLQVKIAANGSSTAMAAAAPETNGWKRKKYKLKTEDGREISVKGFDLKDPKWITKGNIYNSSTKTTDSFEKPTVSYSEKTGKYQIGPFKIDYVSYVSKSGKQYSGIEKMSLYTDASDTPLLLEENGKWSIIHTKIETSNNKKHLKIESIDKKFPKANETFYIELDNLDGATKILDFRVDFKYTNAAGSYKKLKGTYGKTQWDVKSEYTLSNTDNSITGKQYWLEATVYNEESQPVTISDKAYIWEQYPVLDRKFNMKSSKIQIDKKIVNMNGEEIDLNTLKGSDKTYNFNLKVKGAINSESNERITVKAGKLQTSKTYYWLEEVDKDNKVISPIPIYELTEETNSNGAVLENVTITDKKGKSESTYANGKVTGKLVADSTIKIQVTNKLNRPKNAYLQVIKKIVEENGLDITPLTNRDYKFKVTITGDFYYKDVHYTQENPLVIKNGEEEFIRVKSVKESATPEEINNATWTIDQPIKWYGENAPTYTIEEIDDDPLTAPVVDDSEDTTTDGKYNKSGTLLGTYDENIVDNQNTCNVVKKVFKNEPEQRKTKLTIIKTLENYNNLSKDIINNFEFKFKVKINDKDFASPVLDNDDYDTEEIELQDGTKYTKYIWSWSSTDISWWAFQNAPTYSIVEQENPQSEGTIFYTINKDSEAEVVGAEVKGKLRAEVPNTTYEIKNEYINKVIYENGTLEILKTIGDINQEDESKIDLKDKIFKFNVDIKGTFSYDINNDGTIGSEDIPFGEHTIRLIRNSDGTVNSYIVLAEDGKPQDENVALKCVEIKPQLADDNKTITNNSWTAGTFTWIKGKTPEYKVEEDLTDIGTEVISNSPTGNTSGNLVGKTKEQIADGDIPKIIVEINNRVPNPNYKYGKIYIEKTLEAPENYPKELIRDLVFKFSLEVKSNPLDASKEKEVLTQVTNPPLELKCEQIGDNQYIWRWESDVYVWDSRKYDAPTYKIEEVDIPAGVEFVRAYVKANGEDVDPDDNPDIEIDGKIIKGKILPNDDTKIIASTTNCYINKLLETNGKIAIEKQVTSPSLIDKDFVFDLTIHGTFTYQGKRYINEDLVLTPTVKGGSTWNIEEDISWPSIMEPPTYVVTERESEIAELVEILNSVGSLEENKTVLVIAKNKPKYIGGYIKVEKQSSNLLVSTDDKFSFRVKVNGDTIATPSIGINETWTSDRITWEITEEPPTYDVDEINLPEGYVLQSIEKENDGRMKAEDNATVRAIAINNPEEHEGQFKVKKEIVADSKLLDPDNPEEFKIVAEITGTFQIKQESGEYKNVINGTEKLEFTLKAEEIYTSPLIKWFGENPPVVKVTETEIPLGWRNIGISNNDINLYDGLLIVVTNELPTYPRLLLTIDFGGQVWHDVPQEPESKNTPESVPNGKINENEEGVPNVEVYIYTLDDAGKTVIADLRDSLDAEIAQPVYTDGSGKWKAEGISLPKVEADKYIIEFRYDGQTYEPTKYLVTGDGDASKYKNAPTGDNSSELGRDDFANDSMALDYDRDIANKRFNTILGNTPIDGNGNTAGIAKDVDGTVRDISYTSNANMSQEMREGDLQSNSTRVVSKVVTKDNEGKTLDAFKVNARTYVDNTSAQLKYPFDEKYHIEHFDRELTGDGLIETYKASATYDYTLHINLGLVTRPESDVGIAKDLYDAKVVVNDKLLTYRFNKLADFGSDVVTRTMSLDEFNSQVDNSDLEYQLGVYKTDYYYRADLYKSSENYDAISNFYKAMGASLEDTEMEVYLRYKISLYNESPYYVASINGIADYIDSSFGEPLKEEETRYLQTVDGKETNAIVPVADKSTISLIYEDNEEKYDIQWNMDDSKFMGSDNKEYSKLTANFDNIKIGKGYANRAEIYVTFKVQKGTIQEVRDAIKLGNKSNVAEIKSYSTYNTDGTVAGKIDKDSAPDNINIKNYNERLWYEDDTSAAPVLKLEIEGEETSREISGIAWEDRNNGGTVGTYDSASEALIGGLTTQLVEKVKGKQENEFKEYDFIWPTSKPINALGGKSLYSLTGFDSTIETSRDAGTVGQYKFNGVPTGNYIVRFAYGIDKAVDLDDTSNITGNPTALRQDGSKFADILGDAGKEVLTANYGQNQNGTTPAVYNGQDYKSTVYQTAKTQKGKYLTNDRHDFSAYTNSNIDSDARDSEVRRLQVIANSTTLTNDNTTDLAEANKINGYYEELFDKYSMYADTAKINLYIENIVTDENKDNTSLETMGTYSENGEIKHNATNKIIIKDIDIGLVERPRNDVELDQQVSSVKITTNDKVVIFEAKYDIKYKVIDKSELDNGNYTIITELDNNKYLVGQSTLKESSEGVSNVLQELNKIENKLTNIIYAGIEKGRQNFKYINIDDTILQGSTIEIKYQMTAINIGEADTVSSKLASLSGNPNAKRTILGYANELKENNMKLTPTELLGNKEYSIGEYIGTEYYTGGRYVDSDPAKSDKLVTTRIRQLVDYVDNDAVFSAEYNSSANNSWRNANVTELSGYGMQDSRILGKKITEMFTLMDKNEMSYTMNNKNNIALSIDTIEEMPGELHNREFEAQLVPYNVQSNNTINTEGYKAFSEPIVLTVTRTVAAEDDADNMQYDNLVEVIKYENTSGRRDFTAVAGNADPKYGEFEVSMNEKDASSSEVVTFTPPTGLQSPQTIVVQVLLITIIAIGTIAIGIVIIKRKLL